MLKFRDGVAFILYSVNVLLVLINIMLIAELNHVLLFYSVSLNIILINTALIHKYASRRFNLKYMYIFSKK